MTTSMDDFLAFMILLLMAISVIAIFIHDDPVYAIYMILLATFLKLSFVGGSS